MNKLARLADQISEFETDYQVLGFWEQRQVKILEILKSAESEFELATDILFRLAHLLNKLERYATVFYLYSEGYKPIAKQLPASEGLNELKYELGKGLHHKHKYALSHELFEELAQADFDLQRIEPWKDQSYHAYVFNQVWIRLRLLPGIFKLVFFMVIAYLIYETKSFLIVSLSAYLVSSLLMTAFDLYSDHVYYKEFDIIPKSPSTLHSFLSEFIISCFIAGILSYFTVFTLKDVILITSVHFIFRLILTRLYSIGIARMIGSRESRQLNS